MNTASQPSVIGKHGIRVVPVWVWLAGLAGAIAGALLAEPGDVVGNTIPSVLTFLVAGLVLGCVAWAVVAGLGRRRR